MESPSEEPSKSGCRGQKQPRQGSSPRCWKEECTEERLSRVKRAEFPQALRAVRYSPAPSVEAPLAQSERQSRLAGLLAPSSAAVGGAGAEGLVFEPVSSSLFVDRVSSSFMKAVVQAMSLESARGAKGRRAAVGMTWWLAKRLAGGPAAE